jgi:hypothetical protein
MISTISTSIPSIKVAKYLRRILGYWYSIFNLSNFDQRCITTSLPAGA